MPDTAALEGSLAEQAAKSEIVRLKKVVQALMDRAERSTSTQGSDFSLFQTAIMLEDQVRVRTAELESALRENEKINRELSESEAKFRSVVNQSLVGIGILQDGKLSYSNSKFNEIFGYSADEIRFHNPLDNVVEDDRASFAENMRKGFSGASKDAEFVFRGMRKDGTVIDIELHGSATEIGGKPALIGLIMDVTARTRAEREVLALQERLREQAIHDTLTGLYNRRYLDETIGRELIAAERHAYPVSVVMGDLDHFKAVNDRYGHLAGDEVLRVFGGVMKRHARGSDIYCRYGGEEFLLVMPRMAQSGAIERAEHLRSTMASAPVSYGTAQIAVTASFGVASFPADGRSGDDLIAAADAALYAAKAAGRNCVRISGGPLKP